MIVDDELLAIFKAEVGQQLGEISEILARAPATWAVDQAMHLAHNVKGAARTVGVDSLEDVAHALEDLFGATRGKAPSDAAVLLAREGARLLEDCFFALDGGVAPDTRAFSVRVAALALPGVEDAPAPVLPEVARAHLAPAEEAPATADPSAPSTIRIGLDRVEALTELSAEITGSVQRTDEQRVATARLKALLAEIARARPELRASPAFREAVRAAGEIHRGVTETADHGAQLAERLRDSLRLLRMVRFDTLRPLFAKTLRDACADAGREATLRVEGEQVELDRAVLERLRAPLVHLLRNAIAHGVEPAGERAKRGKAAAGQVRLAARAAGEWAEISVADDGRGIDRDALARRAVDLGLATPAEMDHADAGDLYDLMFRPGFSTAAGVSKLAGRGFGLDIVKGDVSALGGTVALSSEPGRGTTFRLRVPLTRLTLSAILVRAADQTFAVPTAVVERTVGLAASSVRSLEAEDVIPVGDDLIAVVDLAAALELPGAPGIDAPDAGVGVVLVEGSRRRALRVDAVLGQTGLTIQPLPPFVGRVRFVSSASVLGSGELVLVLDAQELIAASGRRPRRPTAAVEARRRRRIVVADDSLTARTLSKNILTAAGYDVVTATDGERALEIVLAGGVDLVLSDVDMPHVDGLELTRRIRAAKGCERLPVILVTSLGSDEDRQRGADAGADAYIIKGAFDQEALLRAVGRLL